MAKLSLVDFLQLKLTLLQKKGVASVIISASEGVWPRFVLFPVRVRGFVLCQSLEIYTDQA